jgi:hypothetical protein
MTTADKQWPLFYSGLQQLKQLVPKPSVPASATAMPAILQQSAQLSVLFNELAAQHPASIIAQLNLTPRQLSPDLAKAVKMLVLSLILGRCCGWQNQRTERFLQAGLVTAACSDTSVTTLQAILTAAKALQQHDKQQPLLALLIGACNSQRHPPWLLHPDGPLLARLSQLADQMLPATGSQPGLAQLLSNDQNQQADMIPPTWCRLLQQLAEIKALPGRFAKATQAADSSAAYWFISGIVWQSEALQVYVRQFDPASKTLGNEVQQRALAELTLLNPQFFRDINWLAALEPDPSLLPQTPDCTLQHCFKQSLFDQLNQLSISKQVQMLESRPLLSQYLQHAAAGISRQQLPVNRLRHAISMLGQDALQDWVAQAELYQFCLWQGHPHHAWLEQLQHCLAQALRLLSSAMPEPLEAGTAGLIARCVSASLWQQPALSAPALARQVRGQQLLGVYIQQHIWQAKDYPQHAQQLLEHYQQPDWALAMQDWHSRQATPLVLLLRLSWQLALAVFLADDASNQRFTVLLATAAGRLNLAPQPATYWQQQLISTSQCYYPLPEM